MAWNLCLQCLVIGNSNITQEDLGVQQRLHTEEQVIEGGWVAHRKLQKANLHEPSRLYVQKMSQPGYVPHNSPKKLNMWISRIDQAWNVADPQGIKQAIQFGNASTNQVWKDIPCMSQLGFTENI